LQTKNQKKQEKEKEEVSRTLEWILINLEQPD
jgi:hypothetical protein